MKGYAMLRKALFALLFVSPICLSQSLVSLEYQKPKGKKATQVQQLIVESGVNDEFIQLVDNTLPFEEPVSLVYGNLASEGPSYDPETHTIYIPYAFVLESQSYFSKHRSDDKVNQGAIDTLMHTLLHEAGHALVADNRISILGKEEDAVDNLATIIMLNYLDNGGDAAINAADMFDYESDDGGEYYDFAEYAGVHSFNLQRYFATLCLVYGSDPDTYAGLLDEIEEDSLEEQQDVCEETYHQLNDNWHQYLNDSNDEG
ncbi:hypothetical protein BCU93_11985 [Vibrio breoganii]|uniref:DUF4344 domain-containing metallopeptidase n=1 Tax=Vibrio breoganii TaxID=553239 RepID=UPI000C82968F|nr:DUF4344 domain-containing metallopeptidase [Vibrio breoganii]PMG39375.1 hypothetical protein BCU93_11985 [Vibrio breoganii]